MTRMLLTMVTHEMLRKVLLFEQQVRFERKGKVKNVL